MGEKMEQYKILLKLRKKVRHHAEAYATDIFPDYSIGDCPNPSVDLVAAKMGRHMCKVFETYIAEAIDEVKSL